MELRWRHVEATLVKLLQVKEEQMGAFRARLRHLKAVGVPNIPKVGSGTQIIYTREHIAELYLALLVMRFGITPKVAAWVVSELQDQNRHPGAMEIREEKGDFFFVLFPTNDESPFTYSIQGIDSLKAVMSIEDTPGAYMEPPEAVNPLAWKAYSVINITKCLRAIAFVLRS